MRMIRSDPDMERSAVTSLLPNSWRASHPSSPVLLSAPSSHLQLRIWKIIMDGWAYASAGIPCGNRPRAHLAYDARPECEIDLGP
jgi:hypothetical protein